MKIAISSTGPGIEDAIDPRFGRCRYFLVIDTETMQAEAIQNPNINASGGAGIESARTVAERGVSHVLTGNCGPNAFQVFESVGITVVTGVSGTVKSAVENFKDSGARSSTGPSVESHFGMGGATGMGMPAGGGMGSGMGRGMGGGRGMGCGGGRGMGFGMGRGMSGGMGGGAQPSFQPPSAPAGTADINRLRAQADALEQQLASVRQQIDSAGRKRRSPAALVARVDADACEGCGACADVCPESAITINDVAKIDGSRCIACGMCVAECPAEAISMKKAQSDNHTA